MITQQEIDDAAWEDISIQQSPTNNYILLFICPNKEQVYKLLSLLNNNAFALSIYINEKKEYSFDILFDNSDYAIHYDTGHTAEQYPPLKLLGEGRVKEYSVGIWKPVGRALYSSTTIRRLDRITLN